MTTFIRIIVLRVLESIHFFLFFYNTSESLHLHFFEVLIPPLPLFIINHRIHDLSCWVLSWSIKRLSFIDKPFFRAFFSLSQITNILFILKVSYFVCTLVTLIRVFALIHFLFHFFLYYLHYLLALRQFFIFRFYYFFNINFWDLILILFLNWFMLVWILMYKVLLISKRVRFFFLFNEVN